VSDSLVRKLRSQIGDDVQEIYSHEALFRLAADQIEALESQLAQRDAALKAADDLARKTMTRQELNSNHDYSRGWNDAVACAKKSAGAYVKARGQHA
jgi:hypothetical protein